MEIPESIAFLDSLIEHLPNMVFVKDAKDLRFVRFNRAGEALLGYPREVLLGKNDYDFFPQEQADAFTRKDRLVLASKKLSLIPEEPVSTRLRGVRLLRTQKIPILNLQGEAIFLLGISEDITDLRNEESDRNFRTLIESLPQIVWTAGRDGHVDYYNQQWLDYTGLTLEQSLGNGWEPAVHPADLERTASAWADAVLTGRKHEVELRLKRAKDGHYRWHVARAVPVRDAFGTIVRWFGVCSDIQDQKRVAEEAQILQRMTARLTRADTPGEVGRIVVDEAMQALGAKAALLMRPMMDGRPTEWLAFQGDSKPGLRSWLTEVGECGEGFFSDSKVALPLRAGSKTVAILGIAFAQARVFDESDQDFLSHLKGLCARALDRAFLRESERKIRDQLEVREESWRFLAEAGVTLASSLDPSVTLSKLAELIVPRLADWCGIDLLLEGEKSPRSVAVSHPSLEKRKLGEELRSRFPRDWSAQRGAPAVFRTGKSEIYPEISSEMLEEAAVDPEHLRILRELGMGSAISVPLKHGQHILGVMTLIRADSKRGYAMQDLGFAEEIAARAALAVENARLYQEARKAVQARDDLLSVTGHELRTPITSLKLQLQMAKRSLAGVPGRELPLSRILAMVESSIGQIGKLTALIDDLLDFTRISGGKLAYRFESADLGQILREVLERLDDQIHDAGCELRFLDPGPIPLIFDSGRLDQVIVNLVTNATKYGAGHPIVVSGGMGSEGAWIQVQDFGIGIAVQDQPKIFNRFERAVSHGHISGFGLGLFIARQIVEAHGGEIQLESELGRGSCFTVKLPASPPLHELPHPRTEG